MTNDPTDDENVKIYALRFGKLSSWRHTGKMILNYAAFGIRFWNWKNECFETDIKEFWRSSNDSKTWFFIVCDCFLDKMRRYISVSMTYDSLEKLIKHYEGRVVLSLNLDFFFLPVKTSLHWTELGLQKDLRKEIMINDPPMRIVKNRRITLRIVIMTACW